MSKSWYALLVLLVTLCTPSCAEKQTLVCLPDEPGCSTATSAEDATADGSLTEDGSLLADGVSSSDGQETGDATATSEDTENTELEDGSGEGTDASVAPPDAEAEPDATEDPDLEGPTIVSMSPEDQENNVALPFEVVLTFNEPLRDETVDPTTFKVLNIEGDSIGGTPVLSADGTQVTLSPSPEKMDPVSPYTVTVSYVVQDVYGNSMTGDYEGVFYTGSPSNMETYTELAQTYAPILHQSLRSGVAQYYYPTLVNFDGDWATANNKALIQSAQEVRPAVYWDVAETRSHIFLFYFYYYPFKASPPDVSEIATNDMAAAVITLAKEAGLETLTPVSAMTYGNFSDIEEMRVYQAEGSLPAGANLVDSTRPWSELATGDRFDLFVTSPLHQGCSWKDGGSGKCELNEGILVELQIMTFLWQEGIPYVLEKDGAWPTDLVNVDYELVHALPQWWARRTLFGEGGLWRDTYSFDYEPGPERPGSDLQNLPSFFDPAEDTTPGRPPWAWSWKPSLTLFTQLPRGTAYLDPAYFFQKRHGLEEWGWDAMNFTGWSLEYYFHGAQGIDERENFGECLP